MNRSQKLLTKFIKTPTTLRYPQIHKILLEFNFEHKRTSGSHQIYQNIELPVSITIPVHGGDCKPFYKKEVSKIIQKIISSK
ncbi:MAG: type II toxin-antitoxin system HicA family toxin [Patescibacteria group bacterium]